VERSGASWNFNFWVTQAFKIGRVLKVGRQIYW
jgi:hypothetical protein